MERLNAARVILWSIALVSFAKTLSGAK